ncbi:hypothetical protein acdb102_23010 [Acidothermaceae bacterium B102]|nr:hypothetical protein acdb102_23010 [Acidothermaceae bacterium B102]
MARHTPRLVEVLVDGRWVPAILNSWHRGLDGAWRANVEYTLFADRDDIEGTRSLERGPGRYPFTWTVAVTERHVRPPPSTDVVRSMP